MASPLATFGLIFGLIFALELIDRTHFTIIALAARYKPWPIWAGASLAFAAQAVIAVAVGALLGAALQGSIVYVRVASGLFLIGYALYLGFKKEGPEVHRAGATAFTTALVLIFLLELGDLTWVLGLNFALVNPAWLVVSAMVAALVLVGAIGCVIGSRLGARVQPRVLEKITVGILLVVGVLTILLALVPGLLPSVPGLSPG